MTLSLQHLLLYNVTFIIFFFLNLSFWLPLIILIDFSLYFLFFIFNYFVKNLMSVFKHVRKWHQSLKIEDSLETLTLNLKKIFVKITKNICNLYLNLNLDIYPFKKILIKNDIYP